MTLIDDRGRIGGRLNVIDAAAAIVLLLLVPLAFAAYLLFRTPTPSLARVVPATLLEGPDQRLEIDGENLRPFMRVSFNTTPAPSFLLGSTKYALVGVPDLVKPLGKTTQGCPVRLLISRLFPVNDGARNKSTLANTFAMSRG